MAVVTTKAVIYAGYLHLGAVRSAPPSYQHLRFFTGWMPTITSRPKGLKATHCGYVISNVHIVPYRIAGHR